MAEPRAGDSGTPLPEKLGIRPHARLAVISAPPGFDETLGALPPGVRVRARVRGPLDVVVFFVTRQGELTRRFPVLARAIEPAGGLWVAWPKRTAGVVTDLTERAVRDVGLAAGLVDNKVCAIDRTWSGLRFVRRVADRASG